MSKKPYFLKYQQEWLADQSRLKIAEKSRRIGWTYTQAYEDVRDAAKSKDQGGMDVWFTSADLSAAREYILYCKMWSELLNIAARDLGEIVLDKDDDVKAFCIEFSSGFRINALSSNPKGFRSKGGKVIIDEYAFHEQDDELWKAASPSILWGYPIRVFSTHNGKHCRFFRMIEDAKRPDSKWSLHRVTLNDAIEDGLVGRILSKPNDEASPEEIQNFIAEIKQIAGDEETYEQEYNCNPLDDKSAYIPYALIYANEHDSVPQPIEIKGADINEIRIEDYRPEIPAVFNDKARLYLGGDIGRKRDLTVFWVDELVGDVYWNRLIVELAGVKFSHQFRWLELLLPFVTRACIDQTGLGMQLVESAQDKFGSYRVEGVTFSGPVKEQLAVTLKRSLEDRAHRIPANDKVRQDINKIKKETTMAGNIRFVGERDEGGHSDRFWALALARHAAGQPAAADYVSRTHPRRNAERMM
jgi:phage FluMu gp28-like protein